MDSRTRLLYWLLNASRGGPTRVKILKNINKKPTNLRQLALAVELDYKTVQGHVEILLDNGIIETPKKRYGSVYFINSSWEENEYFKQMLRGDNDGKGKGKNKKRK